MNLQVIYSLSGLHVYPEARMNKYNHKMSERRKRILQVPPIYLKIQCKMQCYLQRVWNCNNGIIFSF